MSNETVLKQGDGVIVARPVGTNSPRVGGVVIADQHFEQCKVWHNGIEHIYPRAQLHPTGKRHSRRIIIADAHVPTIFSRWVEDSLTEFTVSGVLVRAVPVRAMGDFHPVFVNRDHLFEIEQGWLKEANKSLTKIVIDMIRKGL